jgi:hypothetical protein
MGIFTLCSKGVIAAHVGERDLKYQGGKDKQIQTSFLWQ